MNINELREKATKGPLTSEGPFVYGSGDDEGCLPMIAPCTSKADAALIAHCTNTHQELLEKVKYLHERLYHDDWYTSGADTEDLIKRASEVKVVKEIK